MTNEYKSVISVLLCVKQILRFKFWTHSGVFFITGDVTAKTNTRKRRLLLEVMKKLTDTIYNIQKINSQSDVDQIYIILKELEDLLPGPITVQKLLRIDENTIDSEIIESLSNIFVAIVRHLLPYWSIFENSIYKLFLIEENFDVTKEALFVLSGFLKTETNVKIIETLSLILVKYVKSDCVLVALINCSQCDNENDSEQIKRQLEWDNYIQTLTTLPERVANKLQRHTPMEFSRERFCYYLVYQIVRALDYIAESSYYCQVQYNLLCLSQLLSKIIIHFNENFHCLNLLVDLFIFWSNNFKESTKYVRKKLLQTILSHLNRQAIELLSVIILNKCIIQSGDEQEIKNLLGDNIDKNKDWLQVLTYRIPFITINYYKNTIVVENLIYYLSTSRNCMGILQDLVIRLGSVWSDIKSYNTTNINQHIFTSQILILSVKYLTYLTKKYDKKCNLQELNNILFNGVSKHLNSLTNEIRCIGMATVEILLNELKKLELADYEVDLKFEYENMGDKSREIYENLLEINNKCLLDPNYKTTKQKTLEDCNILDKLAEEVHGASERTVQNIVTTCAVKSQAQTKEIVKVIISDKLDALERLKRNVENDLDSDDDLVPYDMSNDLPQSAKKRPAYVRDLIEKLTEAKDYEEFQVCLDVSEELALQLKNDDINLAIKFLDLFVHLECKFHMDDFDNVRFNTAVAIVCAQPEACAKYLCREFHVDIGKYSIATKILILDILSEAANRIADVRSSTSSKPIENQVQIVECEDLSPDEIIRRRLINKTRYFHSKRPHPFAKAKVNSFAAVSDDFFYPLVYGFGKRQLNLSYHNMKHDVDNVLLLKYLAVVGNIILASKNCPNCQKYCWEIIEIILYLRFNSDVKIQMAVMSLIASIILALPSSILKGEFFDPIMELRSWLVDILTNLDLTLKMGGGKSEASIFAGQVLYLLEKVFMEDDNTFALT